jgi:DNA-binding transcriptional LysR family regulator
MEPLERLQDLLPCISTFVTVVEANGFAAAARRLGTTRSAVSRQVARLEEAWGVKLLRRTTRAVSLTEPGQQAYEHALQIPRLALLAEESAASLSRTPRGRLRVTASVAYGQHRIVPLLPAFSDRYPEIAVDLSLTDRMVDLVEEGFDVAIRLSARLPEGLVARRLGAVTYRLCASPRLPGVERVAHPDDLAHVPAIRFSGRQARDTWRLARGDAAAEVRPQGRLSANTSDAVLGLAMAAQGVGLLPDYVLGSAIDRRELVELLPDWTVSGPFGDAVWAVRAPERRALPKVTAFTDFVAGVLGQGPPAGPGARQDRRGVRPA